MQARPDNAAPALDRYARSMRVFGAARRAQPLERRTRDPEQMLRPSLLTHQSLSLARFTRSRFLERPRTRTPFILRSSGRRDPSETTTRNAPPQRAYDRPYET
jgi:hypothetical protein